MIAQAQNRSACRVLSRYSYRHPKQECSSLKTYSSLTMRKTDQSTTANTVTTMQNSVGSSSDQSAATSLGEGPVIFVGGGGDQCSASFKLSQSELSSQWPDTVTESSSVWSYGDSTRGSSSLPKVIKVSRNSVTRKRVGMPTSLPYAQLCFDPELKTMVTLMEIDFASSPHKMKKSKRVSQLDAQPFILKSRTPVNDLPALLSAPSGTDSTLSTRSGSVLTESPSEERDQEPIMVLGVYDHQWREEADLDLYLLHDDVCDDSVSSHGRCTDSLRRFFLVAYRDRRVPRQRANSFEQPREPFGGIGYRVLSNEI
jgi:hypothetical protein